MPSLIDRALYKLNRVNYTFRATKLIRAKTARGIVSFTFDDFPRSALHCGGDILRCHGVRGTYYASMGLKSRRTEVGECFIGKDLEDLLSEGHELGCHTYSHVDCRTLSSSALQTELQTNLDSVRAMLPSYSLATFAYPLGGVTVRAKALVGRRFAAARSVEEGLNTGLIDLALLRTIRICGTEVAVERTLRLIAEAARRCSWLIFFTHDVDERPSPWGCTPAHLEQLVKAAIDSGCEVLTVRNALGFLVGSQPIGGGRPAQRTKRKTTPPS